MLPSLLYIVLWLFSYGMEVALNRQKVCNGVFFQTESFASHIP